MPALKLFKSHYTLVIVLLCLLVGSLSLLTVHWFEHRSHSKPEDALRAVSTLVVHVGSVIHELQSEKTISSGFLASHGGKFAPALQRQTEVSQHNVAPLLTLLEVANEQIFFGKMAETLKQNLHKTLTLLANLEQMQNRIAAQKITVQAATDYYDNVNSITLAFLVELVRAHQNLSQDRATTLSMMGLIGLIGWVCLLFALVLAGVLLRQLAKGGDKSGTDYYDGQADDALSGTGSRERAGMDRLSRVVGLHSGGITACATELIKVRNLIQTDAGEAHTIAGTVQGETDRLGQEISSVKFAIEQASDNIMAISTASEQLSSSIGAIASASEQASSNISTVASAAEEITANISAVNQSLSHVDQSLQKISQSTQEMTNALEGVRRQCLLASKESDQVNQHAQGSRSIMTELSESAREIGDVIDLINGIAEQTNMLALNASIEAAGAGDAGKGFAVVANEVKELARQTGKATQLIAAKATNIQQKTNLASDANINITDGIGRINQGNAEITLAVDEQTENIQGIAKAMNGLSEATAEVSRNSQELNMAAQDVAKAALEAASSTNAIASSAAEGASVSEEVAEGSQESLALATKIVASVQNTELAARHVQEQMVDATRIATLMHGSAAYLHRMGGLLQRNSNALYISQLEMETGVPAFNVREIKNHILHWQGVLELRLHGRQGLETQPVPEEGVCPVCHWLSDAEQRPLGTDQRFNEAVALHKKHHNIARRVMELLGNADPDGARTELTHYDTARDEFFRKLDGLYLGEAIVQQEQQAFFPWSEQLNVGVQEVDDDHKQLVALVNRLHHVMKEGGDVTSVGAILQEAAEYTNFHFGREEALMRRHNYPGLANQEQEHKKMVAQLLALAERFKQGEFPVSMDIMAFARLWLTQHILGTDMQLKTFFADKQAL